MEKNQENLHILRHSASHIMAQAVQKLFPGTKLAIGPAVDNGFYYDFDTEHSFTEDDLVKIENEMKSILKQNLVLKNMKFLMFKNKLTNLKTKVKFIRQNFLKNTETTIRLCI